jgi:hypothetical protein
MLIKVLLSREKQRTPELPAAQLLPVLVHPTGAFAQVSGNLLGGQNIVIWIVVNGI